MNDTEKERERCAKLVSNMIKKHEDNTMFVSALKRLRSRIQNPSPKMNSSSGGPSQDLTQSGSQERFVVSFPPVI